MLGISEIEKKYNSILHITANENTMSELAVRYYRSSLGNRYKMGNEVGDVFVSGNFAAKAMPEIEAIIKRAEQELAQMLNAEVVTLNCLSGVHAMISSILCCTKPGDVIMTVESNHGGHFCTRGILEMTGRKHIASIYNYTEYTFDARCIAEECINNNVAAIYLDTSVVIRPHPIRELRKLLGDKVKIIYDASHTIGLIMSGVFQNPLLEGADVISANTHKTLPGPHHGIVAFKEKEYGEKIVASMTKSLYSSTHINAILALCVTIFEMRRWGNEYQRQIVSNANELGKYLKRAGIKVRQLNEERFTETHQLHVYIEGKSNKEIVACFLDNNISVNTSKALGDKLFIRLGLQEITRRGLKRDDIPVLGDIIIGVLNNEDKREAVQKLLERLNKIHYGYAEGEEEIMWASLN